jgi:heat shock protein HtpX
VVWFSDTIAIATMRGQEVHARSGPGWLYDMVSIELRQQRAELPMPRVYVCPHAAPERLCHRALARSKAAVAVTQGADPDCMDPRRAPRRAAHELAHIKNRDTLTSTIAATVAGVLAYLAQWGLMLGGGNNREGGNPLVALITGGHPRGGGGGVAQGHDQPLARVRRRRRRRRHRRHARRPDRRAGQARRRELAAHPARCSPTPRMNSLFIVEPFAGRSILNLFASHPPTESRIMALRRLKNG